METVRQIIESNVLSKVIDLPKSLENVLVEVTITPITDKKTPALTRNALRELLYGSHTESLSGVIQIQDDVNLKDLRNERRAKYERLD